MSILDTIKSAFASKTGGGSVLGIDIGSSSIKVVQMRREGGRAILETYGAITLAPYANLEAGKVVKLQPVQLAEALTDLIREANISTDNASIAIPFSASLSSIIEMPNMPKDQLNKMVPIEARKYIPVSTSEVTMDWFVIPQDEARSHGEQVASAMESTMKQRLNKIHGVVESPKKQKTSTPTDTLEILLVAIHNATLEDYQLISSTVGLDVQFYELEVFSAARGALGHGVAPVLIVDIGASTTKIYVIERGIVRMSHLVRKGSQSLTEYIARSMTIDFKKAERLKHEQGLLGDASEGKVRAAMTPTLDQIFSEINRVLLDYGNKYHKNIAKVVFCGGTTAMIGFQAYANEKIDNIVEVSDPFNKVQTPAFLEDVLHEVGPEFTVAAGIALRQLYGSN